MGRKLKKLHEEFNEADGDETIVLYGQEVAITAIKNHILHAIEDHDLFEVEDMLCVYEYADDAKKESRRECSDARDMAFKKGLAKGAAWAVLGLEDRMEEKS